MGCDAAMLALKTTFDPERARDVAVTVEVRFAADIFRITVDHGTIDIARGPVRDADLIIQTDPGTLEALAFAGLRVRAERAATLSIDGDRAELRQLLICFAAPTE